MNQPDKIKAALIEHAKTRGFDVAGITKPDAVPEAKAQLERFLADGAHGDMVWMETTAERRGSPSALWPDVRSVIMLGMNYGPDQDPLAILKELTHAAISVYAKGEDYHELIKARLKEIARWLVANAGGEVKVFVDTAAVHMSSVDYLGDVPWTENESAKNWYARVKSRPSFRAILADTLAGIPPAKHYADLDF